HVRNALVRPGQHLHADSHQASGCTVEGTGRALVPRTTRPRSRTAKKIAASTRLIPVSISACINVDAPGAIASISQSAVAISITYASATGSITFQPSAINWSYRHRGRVQRIQTTKKLQKHVLPNKASCVAMVCSKPPCSSQSVNGMSHPPKNSEVIIADTVMMWAYSAM